LVDIRFNENLGQSQSFFFKIEHDENNSVIKKSTIYFFLICIMQY